jgi:hypothetical protein
VGMGLVNLGGEKKEEIFLKGNTDSLKITCLAIYIFPVRLSRHF